MSRPDVDPRSAMQLLERMFDAEMRFLQAEPDDIQVLAGAFHSDVVVHEPASLPYAGLWKGLAGVADLFRKMGEAWSDVRVEGLEAARAGDTVFMRCTIHLTARHDGTRIEQLFADVLRFHNGLLIEGTPFYYDTRALNAALGQAAGISHQELHPPLQGITPR
jgi:ketosteroid isomerase-like protein